jgi:hypothetical protein
MVVNNKHYINHDKVATSEKIALLLSLWLSCHSFERKPRITDRRVKILSDYIQRKGFSQCKVVLDFLNSSDPHATWIRENRYTFFDNIFNDIKWQRRVDRATKYFEDKK